MAALLPLCPLADSPAGLFALSYIHGDHSFSNNQTATKQMKIVPYQQDVFFKHKRGGADWGIWEALQAPTA